jgi:hypothetical protein
MGILNLRCYSFTLTMAVLSLVGLAKATDQAPVGPVNPKVQMTLEGSEKALATELGKGSDAKLWVATDTSARVTFLRRVERLKTDIQGLPVGPVTPRPPLGPGRPDPSPKSSPPNPGPNPIDPNPTKGQWDDALKELHSALQQKSRSNPDYKLPVGTARDVQAVIDTLATGKP